MLKRKKYTFFYILVLCVLISIFAIGCGSDKKAKDEGTKDVISVYTVADSTGDWGFPAPYSHYSRGPGYIRMSLIFDTLVWKDKDGLTGALAHEWEYIEEDNAYVFNLRDDVKWHDGEKFTAYDVLFTFNYVKEHSYPWVNTSVIKNVEVDDASKVKIYLEKPFAPFLPNVAGTLPILPEHIYKDVKNPEETVGERIAIGTGPFKFGDYNKEHGTYLYKANEDYYLGKPLVEELRFIKAGKQMIPAAIMESTANAGDIPSEISAKFNDEGFSVLSSGHNINTKLMFNHHEAPFNDKKMRKTVAYAVDRDKIVQISQRGYALKGSPGLLPSDNPWYSADINKYEYDLDKSKALLKEAGYNFDSEIELLTKSKYARDAEIIKEDLEKLGLKIVIKSLDDKTVDSKIQNRDFQMVLNGHGGLGGDPQIFKKFVLHKDFNSVNYYKNKQLVELLDEQLFIMDQTERQKVLAKIQKIYADELPALTLYYGDWYWAHDGQIELFNTPGGIAIGVPIPLNKLSFIEVSS